MKVYLSANHIRVPELRAVANLLSARGHEVVSTWIYSERPEELSQAYDISRTDIADIWACDVFVYLADRVLRGQGDRFAQLGCAYANRKRCIVVGVVEDEERLPYSLEGIVRLPDIVAVFDWLDRFSAPPTTRPGVDDLLDGGDA